METTTRRAVGTLPAADRVRGVAILMVMAFHYVVLRAPLDDPWVGALARVRWLDWLAHHAWTGVDLFFVLSGFLLSLPWHLHERGAMPQPDTAAFYRRRFWRIAPAYYVQLAILFGFILPLVGGRDLIRGDLWVISANVVAHGLFLQAASPLTSASLGFNGALWTLSLEMQFYLLLPLVAAACGRRPSLALAISIAIAVLWRAGCSTGFDELVAAIRELGAHWHWSEANVRDFLWPQLPAFAAHFGLGIALAAWWTRRPRVTPVASAAPWRPLEWIGRVSYSAYLYHVPVLVLMARFGRHLPPVLALPLYVLGVFAIAQLSWRYLEPPFRGWRARSPNVHGADATVLVAERSAGP